MRHAKQRFQLNRFTSWRKATLISMAKSLLSKERIITTKLKAKATQPLIEKLIGLAKNDSIANRRNAYKILGEHRMVSILFREIAPRFQLRTSGFTRIISWNYRRGDGASLVIMELTEQRERKEKVKKAKVVTKPEIKPGVKEVPKETPRPTIKKPTKKFLGGLRKIFKKERDSL